MDAARPGSATDRHAPRAAGGYRRATPLRRAHLPSRAPPRATGQASSGALPSSPPLAFSTRTISRSRWDAAPSAVFGLNSLRLIITLSPMARINSHYLKLAAGYLFPEIGRRVSAYQKEHPEAKLIRLGIGDVTRPLPAAVIQALHDGVDQMGRA